MENRILEKIKSIVDLMDELDDMIDKLPSSQSKVDSLLSDYRHLLKENVFKENSAYKIALKIKETELLRAELKQDLDIVNIFITYKNRLIGKDNRPFLLNECYKKTKEWNHPYKYRVLTDEEVRELLEEEKKKRGRPKKGEESNEII